MAPELVAAFIEEFQAHVNRSAREAEARLTTLRRERKSIEGKIAGKIAGIVNAIEDGMYSPAMKERMATLEARRNALDRDFKLAAPPAPVQLLPNISRIYPEKGRTARGSPQ